MEGEGEKNWSRLVILPVASRLTIEGDIAQIVL